MSDYEKKVNKLYEDFKNSGYSSLDAFKKLLNFIDFDISEFQLFGSMECYEFLIKNFFNLLSFDQIQEKSQNITIDDLLKHANGVGNDTADNWLQNLTPSSIFDLIEFHLRFKLHWWSDNRYEPRHDKKIQKLIEQNELNKELYTLNSFNLNENQKLEISEVLRNNEQAQSLLIQIVKNHLEDQYDFEVLRDLLTKDDKKKKLKINI